MKCDVCSGYMTIGKTLYPYERENTLYDPGPPVSDGTMVDCWKCKDCGRSIELESIFIQGKQSTKDTIPHG